MRLIFSVENSIKIRNIAATVFFLVLSVAAFYSYRVVKLASDYVKFQKDIIESDYYQKLLRNNAAVGSGVMTVINHLNTKSLPKSDKILDGLNETNTKLGVAVLTLNENLKSVSRLTDDTNTSLNGPSGTFVKLNDLLDNLSKTAIVFNKSTEDISVALVKVANESQMTIAEVRAIVASPQWTTFLDELVKAGGLVNLSLEKIVAISGSLAVASDQLATASKQAPSAAASIEQLLRGAVTYQKVGTVIGMLATILGAIF